MTKPEQHKQRHLKQREVLQKIKDDTNRSIPATKKIANAIARNLK